MVSTFFSIYSALHFSLMELIDASAFENGTVYFVHQFRITENFVLSNLLSFPIIFDIKL